MQKQIFFALFVVFVMAGGFPTPLCSQKTGAGALDDGIGELAS